MTTFAESHLGDRILLLGRLIPPLARERTWNLPLRLVTEPAPCGDPGCLALRCLALTPDGRRVHLHRLGSREIDVLEHGPASELATSRGDVLAENADKPAWTPWTDPDYRREQADFDDTPNDEGDEQQ